MKRFLVLLVLAALFLGCTQMSAEDVAKEMKKRYESIRDMSGEIVVTTNYGDKKEIYEAKFWMKGSKYRSDDGKTLTVSNGSVVWIYDRKRSEVMRMSFGGERPQFDYGKIIEGLLESYSVKLLGEENIDGRSCYLIEAKPKAGGEGMRMWVDKQFWYPLKTEIAIEGIKTIVEYRNVTFNSGLSDELFHFTPPDGVKVVEKEFKLPEKLSIEDAQRKVNFTILVPPYTAGYEFDHAMVYGDFVQLVYSKGDDKLIITESLERSSVGLNWSKIDVNGREAEVAEMMGMKVLRINISGVEITIAAKLSEEEIVKIAGSMG